MTVPVTKPLRRSAAVTLLTALAACTSTAEAAATYTMYRDPQCGCCENWAAHIRSNLKARVAIVDAPDMGRVKDAKSVPQNLRSCHTMMADGYVIEGHVPARDVARLLRQKPPGVSGLAVPGMPLGAPGMDMGNQTQHYQVIAFGPRGRQVFASY